MRLWFRVFGIWVQAVTVRFASGWCQVGVARRATGNGPRDVSLLRSGTSARVEGMPDSVSDGMPAGGPVSSDAGLKIDETPLSLG